MIRQCCQCHKRLGEKEPFEDKRTTDGLCDKCLRKVYDEVDERKRKELQSTLIDTFKSKSVEQGKLVSILLLLSVIDIALAIIAIPNIFQYIFFTGAVSGIFTTIFILALSPKEA